VTDTLSCWDPGEIGTADLAAEPLAAMGIGGDDEELWSVMLITGPSGWPSACAYWAALTLASATARARAVASSRLSSVRFSDTPLTVVPLPPACTAAVIWPPAAAIRVSVAVSDSLTP